MSVPAHPRTTRTVVRTFSRVRAERFFRQDPRRTYRTWREGGALKYGDGTALLCGVALLELFNAN